MTAIWVTGIGVVSPLGRGAAVTMDRLLGGDRAFGPLSLFDLGASGLTSPVAEVADISPLGVAPEGEEDGWSRTDVMSVIAAREALAHAGVRPGAAMVDLVFGGTTAGSFETEGVLVDLSANQSALGPLRRLLSHPLSSTADHVDAVAGPFRRARSVCSACSSGANAILLGATWIRTGASTCVLAGGADGLCRLTYTGFGALAALDPQQCRPFDRRRAGLSLGEGAAFLVLEPESAARARGARPLVELRGWAVGAEAHHITNPERRGTTAARVMAAALERAGLTASDIDYVNAHGTATPLNDAMEVAALRTCFGDHASSVAVSSSKGQVGHTLGAAGAIEAAITAMAIVRGVAPPTVGLDEIDPDCEGVDHIRAARPMRIRGALSSSFGFGGTDTVLALTPVGAFPRPAALTRRRVVVTGCATVGPAGVLAGADNARYLEPGANPPFTLPFQPGEHLDVARARRIDRAGRLATVAMRRAFGDPAQDLTAESAQRTGAILGSAFGSVDRSTAYMRRVYEKGARYASPADFPNLVPSSPVGHASIYLGLRGPVFAVADLGTSAESALATAADLIAADEADMIAAGGVEEASAMVQRCLGPTCSGPMRGERSEGASATIVEEASHAAARGARVVAELSQWCCWRGAPQQPLTAMRPPGPDGVVFLVDENPRAAAWLDASAWRGAPRRLVGPGVGAHEGAGGFAVAIAVACLIRGSAGADSCRSALVVGEAPDRGYALLLVAPDGREALA